MLFFFLACSELFFNFLFFFLCFLAIVANAMATCVSYWMLQLLGPRNLNSNYIHGLAVFCATMCVDPVHRSHTCAI